MLSERHDPSASFLKYAFVENSKYWNLYQIGTGAELFLFSTSEATGIGVKVITGYLG